MLDSNELENVDSSILFQYYGNNQLKGFDLIPHELSKNFADQRDNLAKNILFNLDVTRSISKTPSWQVF